MVTGNKTMELIILLFSRTNISETAWRGTLIRRPLFVEASGHGRVRGRLDQAGGALRPNIRLHPDHIPLLKSDYFGMVDFCGQLGVVVQDSLYNIFLGFAFGRARIITKCITKHKILPTFVTRTIMRIDTLLN